MDALKFPVIRSKARKERHLSMDDYVTFVTENLKLTVDMKAVRAWKRKITVRAPFVLQ